MLLMTEPVAGPCEHGNEHSGFKKRGEISGIAEKILVFQERFCSTESVSQSVSQFYRNNTQHKTDKKV
jgi:hypothetical protein